MYSFSSQSTVPPRLQVLKDCAICIADSKNVHHVCEMNVCFSTASRLQTPHNHSVCVTKPHGGRDQTWDFMVPSRLLHPCTTAAPVSVLNNERRQRHLLCNIYSLWYQEKKHITRSDLMHRCLSQTEGVRKDINHPHSQQWVFRHYYIKHKLFKDVHEMKLSPFYNQEYKSADLCSEVNK